MNTEGKQSNIPIPDNLSGVVLLAHPAQQDPLFKKSVILVSRHNPEQGALGIILNKPLNKNLCELSETHATTSLANIPVFWGGPLENDQVILAGWQWLPEVKMYKLFFGLSEEAALTLQAEYPEVEIKAYLGYSEWAEGRIEKELSQQAWLLASFKSLSENVEMDPVLWNTLLEKIDPLLLLFANIPNDLNNN